MDLAAELLRVIYANRDRLNASRIAEGEAGRVEIHVNPQTRRLDLQIYVGKPDASGYTS